MNPLPPSPNAAAPAPGFHLRLPTADFSPPLCAATDAAALARLRALPPVEADRLLDALLALPDATARQDHLIAVARLALTLPALELWLKETRAAQDERRFAAFLADVRHAAQRAEAFREILAQAEGIHRVNVALLAARLFDALVARDAAAIETFAHTFAEVIGSARSAANPAETNGNGSESHPYLDERPARRA